MGRMETTTMMAGMMTGAVEKVRPPGGGCAEGTKLPPPSSSREATQPHSERARGRILAIRKGRQGEGGREKRPKRERKRGREKERERGRERREGERERERERARGR